MWGGRFAGRARKVRTASSSDWRLAANQLYTENQTRDMHDRDRVGLRRGRLGRLMGGRQGGAGRPFP